MKVTILYGSATGNAEHIAKELANSIKESKCVPPSSFNTADVMEMNMFKRKKLMEAWVQPPTDDDNGHDSGGDGAVVMKKHALVIICSTTGNGDAPENASRFVRYIKKPPPSTLTSTLPHPNKPLENVAYAVLGLGDTNYDQFCNSAKVIDKKLSEWGAKRAVKLACADEATGLEETVEPWVDGVLGGLEKECCSPPDGGGSNNEGEEGLSDEVDRKLVVSDGGDNADKQSEEARKAGDIPQSSTTKNDEPDVAAANDLPSSNSTATLNATNTTTQTNPNNNNTPSTSNLTSNNKSPTPLFILYGSATGNAEHIAKDLTTTYETYLKNPDFVPYFPSVVCCELNQYKKKCLDQWTAQPSSEGNDSVKHGVVIVCSTTGNADAPENADRFVRWLKRKSTDPTRPFKHCAYAVLGLGDSNYDVFCAVGKVIDKRLSELGGKRAVKACCADEATGLEESVEPWVGSVIGKLAEVCRGDSNESGATTTKTRSLATPSASTTDATTTNTATAVTQRKMKETSRSSSSMEEKKMDVEDKTITATTPRSPSSLPAGVSTVRNLLSLPSDSPLPPVSNSSLPTMVSSLSSCELIHHDEGRERGRSRGDSMADTMTVSSAASSGFLYTAAKPYESTILDARYLTCTDGGCAKKVADEILLNEEKEDEVDERLARAMKMYEEHFPLSSPPATTQFQCDKNSKRVIEMTLSLPDDFTLEYEPGDSVGLLVQNTPQSTNFILDMLQRNHGILLTQKVSVDENHPITVREAIQSTIDLCSTMKKKRLFLLSMYATDPEEEHALRLLCSSDNTDLFERYVEDQHRSIVDILKDFPSCQSITLEGLLGCLPAIAPRYYSICSSPLYDEQQQSGNGTTGDHLLHLKVAFSVVDYLTPRVSEDAGSERRMGGLATRKLECVSSPYLCNSATSATYKPPTVQIFPKPTHEFRLPSNMSTPLILIGPGTGIAPFIGFLSHRQAQMASLESTSAAEMTSEGTWRGGYELGPNELALSKGDVRGLNLAVDYMSKHSKVGEIDLFFGCRYSEHDYLYKNELEGFRATGILTNLYTAFSRDREEKTYVQTLMQKNSECSKRLVEMIIEKKASVYVCGDGNAMGREVQETVVTLLSKHFCEKNHVNDEVGRARAVAHVDQMKTFGRFVLDIWS